MTSSEVFLKLNYTQDPKCYRKLVILNGGPPWIPFELS
jgi:hypothetical protein